MAAPDRQEHIPDFNNKQPNNQFLGTNQAYSGNGSAQRVDSANRLNHNASKGSLAGSSSAQKLVEEKHLGPQIMKQKVGTAVAYE